ncbi:MAG TPA: hypothetical protein VEL76_02620 [Gemmataceae bacterium]|nr:hypothetical protein [Gemmataceae bacterium]
MTERPALFLKQCLLLFWAVWLTVVFATNFMDRAKALGLLPESWSFASGNYQFVCATTARYGTPAWLNGLLFLGVVVWEGVAALLCWRAWWRFGDKATERRRPLYAAFTVSLLLWAAFLVADEVFISYTVAGTHLWLFVAQVVTLLAIELLPEE